MTTSPKNQKIKTCNCGVPNYLHGTSCGWVNAGFILSSGETSFVANMTGEEKKERYLQSIENGKILKQFNRDYQNSISDMRMPTDKQLIDIAILFNEGKLDAEKLGDMVGMCQFVLDRLKENNDVTMASSKEIPSSIEK